MLSRDRVTLYEVWTGNLIYWTLWYITHDYALQVTVTHTHKLLSTVTSSQPLLGSGYQRRTFLFLWVPGLLPISATSFSEQQLTTTETDSLTNQPKAHYYNNTLNLANTIIGQKIAAGHRHHSSGFRDPSEPTNILLFFPDVYVFWNGDSSLKREGVWLLLVTPSLVGSDSADTDSH
jgi:hypothetical protein